MEVRVNIDGEKVKKKVTNDRFGIAVSKAWKDLIDPYTPRDTGMLMGVTGMAVNTNVPFQIQYKATQKRNNKNAKSYAAYVYYGKEFNFQKKNPYSTFEWDKAAARAGQKDKLCRTLNSALKNGNY